jgi:UDP-N-acetylglucosamine 2-epimerase
MPEEINRLLTDHLADLLFTPSEDGDENLRREGIPATKIFFVGNVMIDSLVRLLPLAKKTSTDSVPKRYALVTLHRPANVDDSVTLKGILESLLEVNRDLAVVFPAHPRTRKRISDFGLNAGQLLLLDPLPYQVSTPPATSVRIRLSGPFITDLPCNLIQALFRRSNLAKQRVYPTVAGVKTSLLTRSER